MSEWPYTIEVSPLDGDALLFTVTGPTPCRFLAWDDEWKSTAENVRDELNLAFAAGAASRDAEVERLKGALEKATKFEKQVHAMFRSPHPDWMPVADAAAEFKKARAIANAALSPASEGDK